MIKYWNTSQINPFTKNKCPKNQKKLHAVKESFSGTLSAGRWILNTPSATVLILIGLFYDSIIRVFYTVLSFSILYHVLN